VPELPLTMPKMSMTMEEGTMVSWLKAVGDPVRAGEPICEVATDKVDMEVESPYDGVLARIIAEVDQVIAVGEPIGIITTDADDLLGGLFDEPAAESTAPSGTAPADVSAAGDAPAAEPPPTTDRIRAVPLARSIAADRGIDLRDVTPTGPWHTIRVSDLDSHTRQASSSDAAAPVVAPPAPAPVVPVPSATPEPPRDPEAARRRRARLQLAKVMSVSATVPQFTAYAEVDLEAASAVRHSLLGGVSWTVVLVRAQARALEAVPALLQHWEESGPVGDDGIGVALAVDAPNGLIAPVLRDPHRGSLDELASDVADAVGAARAGTLGLERLSGGTTVFSNLGGFGVERFNSLLTPPHATAMSAGSVSRRVVVTDDGALAARLRCTIGITVDHRVADGADGARFLTAFRELLADPARLR
jgi:pyruvate dehydrogenase E2 component (dihydrolipoamide acetyltransferase)